MERRGGRGAAVSHQHDSQLQLASHESNRVELKEVLGPKCLQLEGHPNLLSHIQGAHQRLRPAYPA